jgi:hypothetical protein
MGLETAALVSIGAKAVGAGMSFAQASRQKKLQRKAEREASIALQEARNRLSTNYMEDLEIAKEPFELAREASMAASAQMIEAARESERGVAGAAGRIQYATDKNQRQIASQMARSMDALNRAKATEASRLASKRAGIDLQESIGAQVAAGDAEYRRNMLMQRGVDAISSMAGDVNELIPLYGKTEDSGETDGQKADETGGVNIFDIKSDPMGYFNIG